MAAPHCAMCDKTGKLRCVGCSSIQYCSKRCQKFDWPIHKLVCKSFTAHINARPSAKHYSVIIFPKDEEKPRFEWLEFELFKSVASGIMSPKKDYLVQLGFGFYRPGVDNNSIAKFEEDRIDYQTFDHIAGKHIGMLYTKNLKAFEEPLQPDLPTCKSLLEINSELARSHGQCHVVVWGVHCPEDRRKTADLNCTPADFRHAVDALRMNHYKDTLLAKSILSRKSGGVIAVRISCEGDKEVFQNDTWSSQLEPRAILSKESEMPTPVADAIGLPLIVRKEAPTLLWRDRNLEARLKNHHAVMLNPPHQPANVGSLIVARKDGKPLLPQHLFALNIYTGERLRDPSFGEHGCVSAETMTQDGLDKVSREDFERWYNTDWMRLPISDKSAPSPFSIDDGYVGPIHDVNMK